MTEQETCTSHERLQAHLVGRLSASAEAALIEHLNTCAVCQATLDALATGGMPLLETARQSGREIDEPNAALSRVLAMLEYSSGLTSETVDEAWLDAYLERCDAPGRIGRIAHYEVIEVIARGGMGVVFKAIDAKLNRTVCLKHLAPQIAANPAARRRMVREAQAAAAVRSEHVVTLYGVEEHRGLPYLVMEFVPGRTLQERLAQEGPLPIREVIDLGIQVADGLAAAHGQGLIHRDVKPGNILWEPDTGRVKITDFGLARAVDDEHVTREGMVVGTPEYTSPEQAGGRAVDHRSDLFSLGSVLYALCTGRSPFAAGGTLATLRRITDEEPTPVERLRPETPPGLARVIRCLQAKDPERRPQSAAEAAQRLAECRGDSRRRAAPLVDRRRAVLGVAAFGVTGGLAALAWRRFGWLPAPEPGRSSEPAPQAIAPNAAGPRVLLVLPPQDFFYTDYLTLKGALDLQQVFSQVASTTREPCWPDAASPQHSVTPDVLLSDVRAADYHAICFIGGEGCLLFAAGGPHAAQAKQLIDETLAAGGVVAAAGIAGVVLAEAGMLKNRRATGFPYGEPPRVYVQRMEAAGAAWRDEPVVEDGPFITARAPRDAPLYIRALLRRLNVEPAR